MREFPRSGANNNHRSPKVDLTLVTFSGIDGAGKSSQIDSIYTRLREAGVRVRLLAFWDDVAVLRKFRELSSHTLFKSEKGVGAPDRPVNRQDKNIKSWYMTPIRLFLYLLDVVRLRILVSRITKTYTEVVIFDRYLYDELANLDLDASLMPSYIRFLLALAPKPTLAFLLDADPIQARARKPEYPLEFIHTNRASYLALADLVHGITVIAPLPLAEVQEIVTRKVVQKLSPRQRERALQIGLDFSQSGSVPASDTACERVS
jgi:thymidylate kinase